MNSDLSALYVWDSYGGGGLAAHFRTDRPALTVLCRNTDNDGSSQSWLQNERDSIGLWPQRSRSRLIHPHRRSRFSEVSPMKPRQTASLQMIRQKQTGACKIEREEAKPKSRI